MKLTFTSPPTGGTLPAIPSKSAAHRMLICASLADAPTEILCPSTSADIDATADCLRALGARVTRTDTGFHVAPAAPPYPEHPVLDCGESGSTLRFLLPVVGALGIHARFVRRGRLAQRPLSPLYEEMIRHGACLPEDPATEPLPLGGKLTPGAYTLAANVSSQFISGLLMAFPTLEGEASLSLSGKIESADYIRITKTVMERFGASPTVSADERTYSVPARGYRSPGKIAVEGDWSNAALWLVMGAIGRHPITVTGLDPDSPQGDRRIADVLRRFGADVRWTGNGALTAAPAKLCGCHVDAAQIPDLVPVIAAAAAAAEGETVITGIARLHLKESDRVAAVTDVLSALGADIVSREEAIVIRGGRRLHGGVVSSHSDHRMVMCAACAALLSDGAVTVTGAQSVNKSYPGFARDFAALGGTYTCEED